MCSVEWLGRLKCRATGLDASLSSFSTSRRCSWNRSPNRLPVSPMYRFCSHINFIGRCLQSKVIPKGFRSNFHASSFSRSNQYLYQIQSAQNSFSRNIMRITIRAMCLKRDDLDKQILQCRSELSKICPVVLVNSIRAKIQELNATLFNHLNQIKTLKLEHLIGPKISSHATFDNQNTAVTIPENLPLTDSEKSVLSKGLNFVPIAKRTDEFSVKQDASQNLE